MRKVDYTKANFGLLGPIWDPHSDPLIVDFAGRIWRSSRGGVYVSGSTVFLTSPKKPKRYINYKISNIGNFKSTSLGI